MKYIGCTSCDYRYPLIFNYIYSNDDDTIRIYPELKIGWCLHCNDFRVIQTGIRINDVINKKISYTNELGRLERKFIKLPQTKDRIGYLRNKILECDFLIYILDNKDSYNSCTKCGSTNVIFKDIEKYIWCHNKNKCIGHYVFKDDHEDIRFRIEPARIFPVTKEENINIVELIAMCSLDMFGNHNVAMFNYKMYDYIPTKDGAYCLFIRQAFIIAHLCYDKEIELNDTLIKSLYDYIGAKNSISFEEYKSYILKAFDFFDKEIDYSKVGKYFIPSKICYPFVYPKIENLSHDIRKKVIDLADSFPIWNVITYTYQTYFPYKK